ncbi:unnamed protein product [Gordionus sp. m RMFG-2023]|uniref:ATPase inhibitor mai-1, mitochondrial-like n=1 Tax=Gordionus sp. m RMFG-2023 TaxID=3053472 RepID=UPI0030E51553
MQLPNLLKVVKGLKLTRYMTKGDFGSGATSGGGGGGSIREAGGKFGEMGAAREEEYFRKLQKHQLDTIKTQHNMEIGIHEEAMKKHAEAIKYHKKMMKDLNEK